MALACEMTARPLFSAMRLVISSVRPSAKYASLGWPRLSKGKTTIMRRAPAGKALGTAGRRTTAQVPASSADAPSTTTAPRRTSLTRAFMRAPLARAAALSASPNCCTVGNRSPGAVARARAMTL